ncbi:MAG: MFS transporter, partial [Arsukibacterium sp.]|nr:MFS transporter [Arsukibacterium sp.]
GWDHWTVGGFLALWVIGYGGVQSIAPLLLGRGNIPDGKTVTLWALLLCSIPALIALALTANWHIELALLGGLLLFGIVFAINSSVHSYLIVSYAKSDGVSMDVGFYYMANAMGRLLGTVLSGWLYQTAGLATCLWVSTAMLVMTVIVSGMLPTIKSAQ